jgi:hypothetical protein
VEYIHYSRCLAGVVFNPGAYTHYSWALHDAIAATPTPVIEIHIANLHTREEWRQHSCVGPVCKGTIVGAGIFVRFGDSFFPFLISRNRASNFLTLVTLYFIVALVSGLRTSPAFGGKEGSGSERSWRVIVMYVGTPCC